MDSAKALRDAHSQWIEQWAEKRGIPAAHIWDIRELTQGPFTAGFSAGLQHAIDLTDTCDQEPDPATRTPDEMSGNLAAMCGVPPEEKP